MCTNYDFAFRCIKTMLKKQNEKQFRIIYSLSRIEYFYYYYRKI